MCNSQKSIEINGFENRVKLIECGVSDRDEVCHFEREIAGNYGAMSMASSHIQNIQNQKTSNFPIKKRGGVQCRTIDSLNINEKIALVKLDIEGMEPAALRGARALISKNLPLIYIESQKVPAFNENADILEDLGYVHFRMWDIPYAATHLFRHQSSINHKEWHQKMARDMATLRLYHSSMAQGTYLENLLARLYDDERNFKEQLILAMAHLLGGTINGKEINGTINTQNAKIDEILQILKEK